MTANTLWTSSTKTSIPAKEQNFVETEIQANTHFVKIRCVQNKMCLDLLLFYEFIFANGTCSNVCALEIGPPPSRVYILNYRDLYNLACMIR